MSRMDVREREADHCEKADKPEEEDGPDAPRPPHRATGALVPLGIINPLKKIPQKMLLAAHLAVTVTLVDLPTFPAPSVAVAWRV